MAEDDGTAGGGGERGGSEAVAPGPVREGDVAPDFTLGDQDGTQVHLADLRGRWVVLYFYPGDDTPGCTRESCSFRDSHEAFTDAGAVVLGVNHASAESHKRFAEKNRLPFQLLVDEGNQLRGRYGVAKSLGILPGRVTYVIDPDGVVRKVFNSQLRFTRHIDEALAAIRG